MKTLESLVTRMASSEEGIRDVYKEGRICTLHQRRYTLDQCFVEGGFGTVYLALPFNSESAVAVKILHNNPNTYWLSSLKLYKELPALDCIPSLVDYGVCDGGSGEYAVITEYIDGFDLFDIIDSIKLTFDDVTDILEASLESLQMLQDAGLIHRDIKLENIMIDKSGRLKYVDLDFLTNDSLIASEWENERKVFGTEQYASPERFLGINVFASDVYSLGITMREVYDKVKVHTPSNIHNQKNISYVNEIIEKMCRINYLSRYQCAREALDDLRTKKAYVFKESEDEKITIDPFVNVMNPIINVMKNTTIPILSGVAAYFAFRQELYEVAGVACVFGSGLTYLQIRKNLCRE